MIHRKILPTPLWLKLTLQSDATFGRGDGVAGLVDAEVQHDDYGLPYLSGRALKGLLVAQCAEILAALRLAGVYDTRWSNAAHLLFGVPGSTSEAEGRMHVSDATLPSDLRAAITHEFEVTASTGGEREANRLRHRNLAALTALRRQTALDARTGAPLRNTLRTMRVIIRDTPFIARLDFADSVSTDEQWLLAACAQSLRRIGTGRNRGRGSVVTELYRQEPLTAAVQPITLELLNRFEQEVRHVCS